MPDTAVPFLDAQAVLVLMYRDIDRVFRVVTEADKLTPNALSLKTLDWFHRRHAEWAEKLACEEEVDALRRSCCA